MRDGIMRDVARSGAAAAVVLGLVLCAAAPASAQAPPTQAASTVGPLMPPLMAPVAAPASITIPPLAPAAPSAEARALGLRLAKAIVSEKALERQLKVSPADWLDGPTAGPGWRAMMQEALSEALAEAMPDIQEAMGDALARYFTLAELKAGDAIFYGPAGAYFRAAAEAGALSRPPPPITRAAAMEMARMARSPATQRFMSKYRTMQFSPDLRQVRDRDVVALVVSRALRRFGEKAEAARQAPAADAPMTEAEALGLAFARKTVAANYDGYVTAAADRMAAALRPEWSDLARQAFEEEIAQDRPQIEMVFARSFAAYFTLGELRASAEFIAGPGFEYGQAVGRAMQAGQPKPEPTPEVQIAYAQLMSTPEGASFLQKLAGLKSALEAGANRDLAQLMTPGTLRRLGEKAQAAEAARRLGIDPAKVKLPSP